MKLLKQLSIIVLLFSLTNCVQQKHLKTITVKVDMTQIENPSEVGIRGNIPLSWDETAFLKDIDGDGIYEETFEIYTANNNFEFKFINHNDVFELENQDNRILTFEYKPETIIYKTVFNDLEGVDIKRE